MNVSEWLIPLLTAVVGGGIGTFLGSWFILKRQETKMVKVRNIAIKALSIIRRYIEKNQPIRNAENEFNNQLSIPEKRSVIVALHKLGVSIGVSANETFDINKICFVDKEIDLKTIDDIAKQIKDGYCDNLFYIDPDSQFSTSSLFTLRNVAKKYVTEVLSKSSLTRNDNVNIYNCELGWEKKFTLGELKPILVFSEQVGVPLNFDENGKPNPDKMKTLLKDIDLGLFDSYLMWNYDMYLNVKTQNNLVQKLNTPNPIKM